MSVGHLSTYKPPTRARGDQQAMDGSNAFGLRFRQMAETIPDALYVYDVLARRTIYANGRVVDVLGYDASELVTGGWDPIALLTHPEDRPVVEAELAKVHSAKDGEIFNAAYRMRHADGSYRFIDARTSVFARTPEGHVHQLISVAADNTEKQAAKLALEQSQRELAHANARLKSTLESITDCYVTIDSTHHITGANAIAAAWIEASIEDVVGRDFFSIVKPETACGTLTLEALAERHALHAELASSVRPGRWIDYHVYPAADGGAGIFFRDVTDRVMARAAVIESAALLQATIDALSAHLAVLDADGVIVAVNARWEAFGRSVRKDGTLVGPGADYLQACREAQEFEDGEAVARALRAVLSGETRDYRQVYRIILEEGPRWYQMHAARFSLREQLRVVVVHEDVTETLLAEQERRALGVRLLETQEEERRRIARELHDSTAQHLVAIGFALARIERACGEAGDVAGLMEARHSLAAAQKEIRTLSYLLHPNTLPGDDFVAMARNYLTGFGARTGLAVAFRVVEPAPQVGGDLATALLRVMQEALLNIYRHADARSIEVTLASEEGGVVLDVLDDGVGFALGEAQQEGTPGTVLGVGISGMHARLQHFGGTLTIVRQRPGTLLQARIPAAPRPSAGGATTAAAARGGK